MFYITTKTSEDRTNLIAFLKNNGVHAVFHYLSLHKSQFAENHHMGGMNLPMSDFYTEHLLRLPIFYSLMDDDVDIVIDLIKKFYESK